MIKIAIVEDDLEQAEKLTSYVERFEKENGGTLEITRFDCATAFLSGATSRFDVVFMDIELPDGDGMEVVRKMREWDKSTLVIFVTNLAQYAVKGYEVRAFDFIVKPVAYYNFAMKFSGALDCIDLNRKIEVWIKNKDGKVKLLAGKIKYVEVMKHYLTYHTTEGEYTALGTIGNAAMELKGAPFSFCNRCYLVNLKYVQQITRTQVLVDGEWLAVSRPKYADFLKDLNDYLAGGN